MPPRVAQTGVCCWKQEIMGCGASAFAFFLAAKLGLVAAMAAAAPISRVKAIFLSCMGFLPHCKQGQSVWTIRDLQEVDAAAARRNSAF